MTIPPAATPTLADAADALAGVLERENALLAALDLPAAAAMLPAKRAAAEAFRRAQTAARERAQPADLPTRMAAAGRRLVGLAVENRRLLERGLVAQGRVIAVIARAAQARPQPLGRYGANGALTGSRLSGPVAICARV
jgi:hypothetical protein